MRQLRALSAAVAPPAVPAPRARYVLVRAAVTAALVSLALQPLVIRVLRAAGALDVPTHRSSHRNATVRGGGLAVVPALLVGTGAAGGLGRDLAPPALAVVAAAVVGLAEDLQGVPVAALLVLLLAAVGPLASLLPGSTGLRLVAGAVVAVAALAVVNATNFMDGINGITAAQALAVGLADAALAHRAGLAHAAALAAATAGAAVGFAPFNVPRARVFLGDCGSYALGAVFAGLAVVLLAAGLPAEAVLAPLAVTLVDTGTTLLRRARAGEAWHLPHRTHVYQRPHRHRAGAHPGQRPGAGAGPGQLGARCVLAGRGPVAGRRGPAAGPAPVRLPAAPRAGLPARPPGGRTGGRRGGGPVSATPGSAALPRRAASRHLPALPGLLVTVPAIVAAVTAGDDRLLLPALAGASHLLTGLALPSVARWRRPLLRPANFTYGAFSLQLLVLPWLAVLVPYSRPGVVAPSPAMERQAVCLVGVAYLSAMLGHVAAGRARSASRAAGRPAGGGAPADRRGHRVLGWAFVAVGVLGLALFFHDPAALLAYYRGQYVVNEAVLGRSALQGASTFLRPFLTVGVVLLWVGGRRAAGLHARDGRHVLLVVLASSSYSYNRGQVLATALAAVALALAMSGHRPRRLLVALGLVAAVLGVFQLGQLREHNNLRAAGLSVQSTDPAQRFLRDLQLYGNGPQLAGYMVQIRAGEPLLLGRSVVSSLLAPVPVLGRGQRETSGTTLYNRAIYGGQDVHDQIPLATVEAAWNGGLPAVVLFGLLLGLLGGWLDRVFAASPEPVLRFAVAYFGYWTGLTVLGSVEVMAQVVIYFSAPFVVLVLLERVQAPRRTAAAGPSAAQRQHLPLPHPAAQPRAPRAGTPQRPRRGPHGGLGQRHRPGPRAAQQLAHGQRDRVGDDDRPDRPATRRARAAQHAGDETVRVHERLG